jgi:hypothetical protein
MDDKQPVVSLVTLGGEKLLIVKIDPELDSPTGRYTLDIQMKPHSPQFSECTALIGPFGCLLKCAGLMVI